MIYQLLINQKMVKMSIQCFPKPKMQSTHVLICSSAKYLVNCDKELNKPEKIDT